MSSTIHKPAARIRSPRSNPFKQTIVVVGPRDARMAKLIQRASPYRDSRVEFERSPEDLLASYVQSGDARRPGLYVLITGGEPAPASHRKVQKYLARGRQQTVSSSHAKYTRWIDALRVLQSAQPSTPVLVVADDSENASWEAFLEAGADELISPAALQSPGVAKRRIESAFAHARADRPGTTAVVEPDDPLTETQIAEGLAKVRAAAKVRARAGEHRALLSDLLKITVPDLRAASGRLDAQRIAQRLGLSLNAFAVGMPVSRETLRTNPDSKRLQGALDPYARVLAILDTLLPGDGGRKWLNTKHPRFDATPLEAMVAGRADEVARLLELAREGDVD